MNDPGLMWAIVVPGIGGLAAFVLGRRASWLARALAIGICGWLVVEAFVLLGRVGASWSMEWLELETVRLGVDLLVTRLGAVMALFLAAFGLLISVYGVAFTREEVGRHSGYMLWTVAGAWGVVLADNWIFLLLCWEVTTLMLFLLITQGGQKAKAGAAKTFAMLGFSDCALLLAIGLLLFTVTGPAGRMGGMQVAVDSPVALAACLCLLAAALAKAGAMPLHTWIPTAAEGAPTDVMAFLPASVDKILGIYLLARVSLEWFVLTGGLRVMLMVVGVVTILGAVMMALVQHDLKRLLSFHAVSQVGYMVLGIGIGGVLGVAGALFHMMNHAMYKSCLFLVAGSVERQAGTTDLDSLGGLARVMPFTFVACVVAALSISGVPPMNGFTSKWLIYQACLYDVPPRLASVLVTCAVFGSALTLASFVKVIHSVFLGRATSEEVGQTRESPGWMTWPMLVLAAGCIVFGVFARWALEWLVRPAMEGTLGVVDSGGVIEANLSAVWNPALATVFLLLSFGIGLVIYACGTGLRVRRTSTYIGGERVVPEPAHYGGTSFYETVRAMPGIRGVVRDAERESFDVYRITGRLGGSVVEVLRRCQTGLLPLYVSWVVLGLVVIVVYLISQGGG